MALNTLHDSLIPSDLANNPAAKPRSCSYKLRSSTSCEAAVVVKPKARLCVTSEKNLRSHEAATNKLLDKGDVARFTGSADLKRGWVPRLAKVMTYLSNPRLL